MTENTASVLNFTETKMQKVLCRGWIFPVTVFLFPPLTSLPSQKLSGQFLCLIAADSSLKRVRETPEPAHGGRCTAEPEVEIEGKKQDCLWLPEGPM